MSTASKYGALAGAGYLRRDTAWRKPLTAVSRFGRTSPLGFASAVLIALMAATALLAPLIAPYDPLQLHRGARLVGPNSTFLLGTDQFGRDMFSRVIYGTRVSLWVGTTPVALSVVIGTGIGLVAAYFGGRVDALLQRVMDAFMAFPALVLALVMVAMLGASERDVIFVLVVVMVPSVNRVARGSTLIVTGLPYVESARALGASSGRIMLRHVLPNAFAPVLVFAASLIGVAILAEASLSFLGLGVPPPQPTWGNLLAGQNRDVFEVAPWLVIFPGIAITLTVLSFNLLGDSVRDMLDPRLRGRDLLRAAR